MKKAILTAASMLIVATVASYGQSQLQFANAHSSTPVVFGPQAPVGTNVGLPFTGTTGTETYGLYLGAFGSTTISQMQLVDTVASPNASSETSAAAGAFNSGQVNSPGNVANTISFAAGTQYAFIIAAWASADGTDYASALAFATSHNDTTGLFGQSALGFVTPSSSPSPIAELYGSNPGQLTTGFAINPVPEPTTLALGGLGAAALLLIRRRK